MNNLTDEQIDKIIKESFKQDIQISDKANAVFENFKPEKVKEKSNIKEEIRKANKNVIDGLFYKRLNKILSVAAVSLSVVLVGGTALYFNKDKIQNNTSNTQNSTTIVTEKNYLIKNEPLQFSNEQVVKEVENHYVKAYLVGNSDVGVEFLHDYWDELNRESIKISSDIYKIDGIEGNIKDIFVGNAVNSVIPYIFILMDDGTAMYVDLHGYYGYTAALYYYAVPLEGLTDIVGFEEMTRNFSYSKTEYTYVNAIRSDGKRKEIEIGEVNNWDDTSTKTFDRLNEKYVQVHNGGAISDDGSVSFMVDGKSYMVGGIDSRYLYYKDNTENWLSSKLYRVDRNTGSKELIAVGVNATVMYDEQKRICFYVVEEDYEIYQLDNNIVYKHHDESEINEVTKIKEKKDKPNLEELSDFEKRVYEGGNYYYSKNGHYCIKNPREVNITYYIVDETLYRVIISNNDSVASVATGVTDIREDEDNNLIVTLSLEGSLFGNYEGNVIFQENSVTNSPIMQTSYDENFDVLLKEDGSISILLHTGALKRLGFDPEKTAINENVYYNVFGSTYGVENNNNHFYYANAKEFCFAPAGRNGRECLVYYGENRNVIAVDILNAIQCGSFTGAKTSTMYVEEEILSLYWSEYSDDVDENGNRIPTYKTTLISVKDKNGKEFTRHMYMPCEDL